MQLPKHIPFSQQRSSSAYRSPKIKPTWVKSTPLNHSQSDTKIEWSRTNCVYLTTSSSVSSSRNFLARRKQIKNWSSLRGNPIGQPVFTPSFSSFSSLTLNSRSAFTRTSTVSPSSRSVGCYSEYSLGTHFAAWRVAGPTAIWTLKWAWSNYSWNRHTRLLGPSVAVYPTWPKS